VNLSELQFTTTSSGGVVLTHDGPAGGLVVSGGLEDEAVGYSAHLLLSSVPDASAKVSEVSYAALGLMSGVADPMMSFPAGTVFAPYAVVRNMSNQPVTATPTLWWMQGGAPSSAQLAAVTLAPHQTQNLDVASLIAGAGLKNFNGSVNLVLDAKGQEGALLLASGSVDQKNTYVFEAMPHGILESIAKNVAYWSTANGNDTMVTLWNPADEPQDFVFTLFYTGGHYGYPIHLAARATQTFNISEIQHSQIPDAEGNVVPAGVQEGSAEVSGSQGENEHILVALEAGIYNVQKATCNNPCVTCDGLTSTSVIDNPFALAVAANHQLTFVVQYNTGAQYNRTSNANWSSTNTGVATVSTGLVHGVSVGSVTANVVSTTSDPVYGTACNVSCPFAVAYPGGSGPGNTVPRIDSVTPNTVTVGTSVSSVTIAGAGFGSAPVVNLPQGVTVLGGQGSTDTQIILNNVSVSINAPIGPNSMTVTAKGTDGSSQTSNSGAFTLDGPFYMTVLSDNMGKCQNCTTTVERFVQYQVVNLSGANAGTTRIGESYTQVAGWNCTQTRPSTSTTLCSAGVSTASGGTFTDGWTLNSDSYTPSGCGETGNNTDHWQWCAPSPARTIGTLTGGCKTNSVTINGYTNPPNPMPAGKVINP